MKNIFRILLISILSIGIIAPVAAEQYKGSKTQKKSRKLKESTSGCSAAAAYQFLDINNVRARINTGGDMWWNLISGSGSFAQYYIPGNTTKTSLFSGSLWIGGLDVNDQLKLAALRYRGEGNDYWPGPLTIDGTAAVDAETCAAYDRFFKITREQVDEFISWYNSSNRTEEFPDYSIPAAITEWPAHGDVTKNQSYYLAPFFDNNEDGYYDPNDGDYPYYDIDNSLCPINYTNIPDWRPTPTPETLEKITTGGVLADQVIKGDETLWWVFNDKGNFHSETEGASIGLEIRAQAFAFATNDEINNMTFYSYEIINRSTFRLRETYFSPWADTDLGYARDDYVGCDVERGMGYCYNGTDPDGNGEIESYGPQPPAIGVDFFQGPYMDPDGLDNPKSTIYIDPNGDTTYKPVVGPAINGVNFGNGIKDDERFGMRRFVYHNNNGVPDYMLDPDIAPEYYNYLRGIWKDGTKMLYGGNGHQSAGAVGPACDFMFPGDSDPLNWGTGGQPPNGGYNQDGLYWTEKNAGNNPDDRRFMQSAGPFTLEPGATNYITVGIPWARAISGGPWASVELLRQVDDKCQSLFDNCFKVLDGPDAPDLAITELNNRLIVEISNRKSSNNYKESYAEYDPNIQSPDSLQGDARWDSIYRFEGYQVFQLANASVSAESLDDPDQARLVAQFDKKNGVSKIINYDYSSNLNANVPVPEVEGGDNGISHTFEITEDAFAEGNNTDLVNFRQYHYMAIAYAYNNYKEYSQFNADQLDGQKKPYLAGRKNIKRYTGIPHPTVNGININSDFGEAPAITRIQGQGNGGLYLELDPATIQEILSKPPADTIDNTYGSADYPIAYKAKYVKGFGPVNIRVVDPLSVVSDDFILRIDSVYSTDSRGNISVANWQLTNVSGTMDPIHSDTTINLRYEQVIPDLGISINWEQVAEPGDSLANNNGLIGSQISYADSSNQWLSGISDISTPGSVFNWIRSGTYKDDENTAFNDWDMSADDPWDAGEYYEKVLSGTWAPYGMVAHMDQSNYGPAWKAISKNVAQLRYTQSVDVVLTPDKSLWTRCPVIEMCFYPELAQGGAKRFALRNSPSVDKDGNYAEAGSGSSDNPDAPNYISDHSMGWFPGYAINLETGERLNIMFGENSYLALNNGRDMLFNPTANWATVDNAAVFGGMHFVYIMGHREEQSNSGLVYSSSAYDAGVSLFKGLDTDVIATTNIMNRMLYGSTMWVGMPIPVAGKEADWLSQDVKISMRVIKPYRKYYSVELDSIAKITDNVNDNNPMYQFSTHGLEPAYTESKKETDLDLIGVVPNPYYAYDIYEENPLDNKVKIINLPQKCTVSIFTVNGTLIRQFIKDEPVTEIYWDLKNFAGIPISGGAYIIHVATDNDERIVKWFGTMRPVDLNTF